MNSRNQSQEAKFFFEQYKYNVHSQSGEDGLIQHFMAKMGVNNGFFVEFGAWDGKHLSNCAHLAEQGWSGCFIEADSERFIDLKKNYQANSKIALVNALVTSTGFNCLDNLLKTIQAPQDLTVLSIDIDGNDYHIWHHLGNYFPLLCIVEFNPTIPTDVIYIQDDHPDLNFGNSLAAFYELAKSKGYSFVAITDCNAFFMPSVICEQFDIITYRPEEIKSKEYEMSIFQGYNGQIVTQGPSQLLWHGINITDEDLQILPKELRKIPVNQPIEYSHALENFKSSRES
jgi:hypothetical protein